MIFVEVPRTQASQASIATLSQTLQEQGITRFYSEYWTCNRLIFESQENLICADTWIVNGKIVHGIDRYASYRQIVNNSREWQAKG